MFLLAGRLHKIEVILSMEPFRTATSTTLAASHDPVVPDGDWLTINFSEVTDGRFVNHIIILSVPV